MPYITHDPAGPTADSSKCDCIDCIRCVCCIETSIAAAFVMNGISQAFHSVEQAPDSSTLDMSKKEGSCIDESMSEFLLVLMSSTCKLLTMVSFLSCRISSPTNLTMPEMAVAISDDATSFAPTNVLSSSACTCTWLSCAACNNDEQNSGNSYFCRALHAQLACAASNCCDCKQHCKNLAKTNLSL